LTIKKLWHAENNPSKFLEMNEKMT